MYVRNNFNDKRGKLKLNIKSYTSIIVFLLTNIMMLADSRKICSLYFIVVFLQICIAVKPPNFPSKLINVLKQNPIFRVISNTYSFFYWLPRKSLPYDRPFAYFQNSTIDFIKWYIEKSLIC